MVDRPTFEEFEIARDYFENAIITFPTPQVVKHLTTIGRYWRLPNITAVFGDGKTYFPGAYDKKCDIARYDSKTNQYRIVEFTKRKLGRYQRSYTWRTLGANISRFNGPAVITKTSCQWIINGERHRTDGPAIVNKDGSVQWYIHNKDVSDEVESWIHANNMQKWEDWTAGDKVFFKMKFYQK